MFKSEHARKFANTHDGSGKSKPARRRRDSKLEREANRKIIEHLNRIKQFMNPKRNDVFERLSQHKRVRTRERNTIGGTKQNFLRHNRLTRVLREHLKENVFFPNNTRQILKLRARHKTLCHKRKSPKTSTLIPKLDFKLDKSLLRKPIPDRFKFKGDLFQNLKNLLSSEQVENDADEHDSGERRLQEDTHTNQPSECDRRELTKRGSSFSTVKINIVNKDTPCESKIKLSKQNSHSELTKVKENLPIKKSGSLNNFTSKKFSATLIFSANRSESQAQEANQLLENLFDAKAPNPKRTSVQFQTEHFQKLFEKPIRTTSDNKKNYKNFSKM